MHLGLVQSTKAEWIQCDVVSKAVIIGTLLFVLFAYLPTLQSDYVTQDQWRAFRYSTDGEPAMVRGKICGVTVWKFYVQTGRPFIWFSECIEHAAVSQISDFKYVRPFVLAIVLLSTLYVGVVLAPSLGGLAIGVSAAGAFMFAPGYSFMYAQGMTAGMVLLSVPLAAASFQYLRIIDEEVGFRRKVRSLLVGCTLFISACLIYPTFAFVVVPLALIEFGFHGSRPLPVRLRVLFSKLVFYVIASVFYYAIIKLSVFFMEVWGGKLQSLGIYDVTVQKTPSVIVERILECLRYFHAMPLLNFEAPAGLAVVLIAIASAVAGFAGYSHDKRIRAIVWTAGAFFTNMIVLLASISPWLVSNMNSLATRHLLPWYLFFCASIVGVLYIALSRLLKMKPTWIPVALLLGVLLPVAVAQHRLSSLEVMVSSLEIQTMRDRISDWVEAKGWTNNRYVLVILPTRPRPTVVETLYPNLGAGDINAALASSQNTVSIPWMLNALLRERHDRPKLRLIDCSSDHVCANAAAQDPNVIALGYTKGMDIISSSVDPFIINLSLFTSSPVTPSIVRIKGPTVTVSSMLNDLGPYGLLTAMQPGWHSAQRPKYPQTIEIDLADEKTFDKLSLLPQDSFVSRMPSLVELSVRSENGAWVEKGVFDDLCNAAGPDAWHTLRLDSPVKARFVRLTILRNCGDPELLTLKGLRFE